MTIGVLGTSAARPASRFVWAIFALALGTLGAECFQLTQVVSTSMEPTVRPNQHVLLLRSGTPPLFWRGQVFGGLRRGDLVVVRAAGRDGLVLKRIVGLGGDRVQISEGVLHLNGAPVPEPYAHHADARARRADVWPMSKEAGQEVVVPPEMLFVLGDNRSESADSRRWGPVRASDVVGRVVLRLP